MRVLIIHYGEPSPADPGYRRMRYGHLAAALVKRGHDVVRILPSFAHLGSFQRPPDSSCFASNDEGTVVHVSTPGYSRSIGPGRLWFLRQFSRAITLDLLLAEGIPIPNVVVCGYPPPGLVVAAGQLADIVGAKLLVDVRDIWPDAQEAGLSVAQRRLVSPLSHEIRRRTKHSLHQADGITATSRRYLDWAIARSDQRRLRTSEAFVIGCGPMSEVVVEADPFTFSACFVGSLSRHFDFRFMIEGWTRFVARLPADERGQVRLVVVGDGAQKQLIAADTPISVRFLGHLPTDAARAKIASATVGLAPYASGATMSLPNKIFEYLAEGLFVISTLGGEAAQMLERVGGGVTVDALDASTLSSALKSAYCLRSDLARSRNARKARVRDEYGALPVYDRFVDLIEATAR